MTNAELLAKIKAEIDRLYGEYKDKFHQCGDQYHLGLIDGLDMAERVFDSLESEHLADASKTLEIKPGDEVTINGHKIVYDKDKGYVTIVKSEESVPNDLEKAAEEYVKKGKYLPEAFVVRPAFIAGAKWQKVQDEKEQADLFTIVALDAAQRAKEQMMENYPKWRKIKAGERLPCPAYVWTIAYDNYPDCFEGRLMPNIQGVKVGQDTWYLPVDVIHNLPKED